MSVSRTSWLLVVVVALGMAFLSTSTAHAQNGSWSWGSPGFSNGLSPQDRTARLDTQGLADPLYNYWTPSAPWSQGPANVYGGTVDTGLRNTFAVNHDINANFGLPVLGYLDIFTPLFGTNELAIAATVSSIWSSVVSTVSQVSSSITSLFSSDYSSYSSTGSYAGSGWDNSFDGGFSDYGEFWGGDGGGCFAAGTPVTMADGSTKSIEDVRVGDRILAYDVKARRAVASEVTQTIVHTDWSERSKTVLVNGSIRATVNHPFFANGRWRRADRLHAGDLLIAATPASTESPVLTAAARGETKAPSTPTTAGITVKSVVPMPGIDTVYNLGVATHHDFFSGGVLVHNFTAEECN